MLEDLENQYETLKADGFVTASDGLKAQVFIIFTFIFYEQQVPIFEILNTFATSIELGQTLYCCLTMLLKFLNLDIPKTDSGQFQKMEGGQVHLKDSAG